MRLSTVFIILPAISAYGLSSSKTVSFLEDYLLPSDPRIPGWRHHISQLAVHLQTTLLDSALSEDPFDSASSKPYFDPLSRSQSTSVIVGPYAKKPDCFRRAAGRIRSRCADIEMDADERVKGMLFIRIYSNYERYER